MDAQDYMKITAANLLQTHPDACDVAFTTKAGAAWTTACPWAAYRREGI